MKKLFISCPMKGRTEENIKNSMEKMHRIAEIVFDQELEVIDTYIPNEAPEGVNRGIWYLGKSIQMLAEADYFIGIGWSDVFKGCSVENEIACWYGIPHTTVDADNVMPDLKQVIQNYYETMGKTCAPPKCI